VRGAPLEDDLNHPHFHVPDKSGLDVVRGMDLHPNTLIRFNDPINDVSKQFSPDSLSLVVGIDGDPIKQNPIGVGYCHYITDDLLFSPEINLGYIDARKV
jgi:hypothetical protein